MAIFNDEELQRIQKAVEAAERFTSGEIRICVEQSCKAPVIERAVSYFEKLGMDKTALRNGVLIYLALKDHKFAIIGDSGINKVVPENFWDSTKEAMLEDFKLGNIIEGIITGVHLAGNQLKAFFPFQDNDINELPDHVIFEDGD
jgi:uncharacterized membrane protein